MAYDNSVYDFSLFETEDSVEKAPASSQAAPKVQKKNKNNRDHIRLVKKSRKVATQQLLHSTLKAFFITFLTAVMFLPIFAFVNAGIEYEQILRSTKATEAGIVELKSEQVRLNAELNSKMTIDRIESYAENVLGMVKLGASNVEYFDFSQGDEITVSGGKSYHAQEPKTFFAKLLSYFQ